MSNKVSLDFEFTQENKKALEELLKASGIRHFIIETKDYGNIDVVEYKEYLKLKEVLDKIKEYIEHENYKRNILLGLSEKKYTRDILNHILEMIEETK